MICLSSVQQYLLLLILVLCDQSCDHCRSDGNIRGVESGLCVDVGSRASCQEEPWSGYPYCNPSLDPDTRAKDLVSRMTVDEKVGN